MTMATAAESTTDTLTLSSPRKEHQVNGALRTSSTSRGAIVIISSEKSSNSQSSPSPAPSTPTKLIHDRNFSIMGANAIPSTEMPLPLQQPQHSSSSYILSHHSSSNLMADHIGALREEDADILELGVEEKRLEELADFDDHGRRFEPVASVASLTDLENQSMVDFNEDVQGGGASDVDAAGQDRFPPSVVEPIISTIPLSPLHLQHSSSLHGEISISNSMPVIDEDSTTQIPHVSSDLSHEQLSGDDVQDTQVGENDDFYIGEGHCQNGVSEFDSSVVQNDLEALTRRKAAGRHQRSDSFDRRQNESALFAEAVGESSFLLKKIIEEDSSSDFDDDDIDEEGNIILQDDEEAFVDFECAPTASDGLVGEECPQDDADQIGRRVVEGVASLSIDVTTDHADIPNNDTAETSSTLIDPSQINPNDKSLVMEPHENPASPHDGVLLRDDSMKFPSRATTPATSPCGRKQDVNARPYIRPPLSFHPSNANWKFIRQHSSGTNLDSTARSMSGNLNGIGSSCDDNFVYRGIRANPPEITQRGVSRGNYAQLHRKAWLEVTDKHHRYGKNLRMYYKHWESLGHPYHMFFDWLDSKGEAEGNPLPEIADLPRSVLDTDTVLYITNPDISASYALDIVVDPADGSAIVLDQKNQTPIHTGKEGWIFILRDHVFYGSQKVTAPHATPNANSDGASCKSRQRFHHSSFFGGKAVASAGIFLTDEHGRMTHLYPHSGHYRPGEAHMQRVLFFLQQLGVELSTFDVDMQQIFKVSRKFAPKGGDAGEKSKDKENKSAKENQTEKPIQRLGSNNGGKSSAASQQQQPKKSKKTDCLHLMGGLEVACFLAHKALMIQYGVFHQVHKIRRLPYDSRNVCAILESFSAD